MYEKVIFSHNDENTRLVKVVGPKSYSRRTCLQVEQWLNCCPELKTQKLQELCTAL